MKRILSLILAVFMLCNMGICIAQASTNGAAVKIADVTAAPGTTAEVTVKVECSQGIKTLSLLDFAFDSTVLSLIENESGWLVEGKLKDVDFDNNASIITFEDNTSLNENIFRLVFAVSETAASGKFSVSCSVIATHIDNNIENKINVQIAPGSVTVKTEIPHTHTPENTPVVENKIDATCTTGGSYDEVTVCSGCGTQLSRKTVTQPALGHNKVSHPAKAPSCTSNGWEAYYTCSRCDYTTYKEISVDANAHKWDSGKITREATCINEGVKTYTCQYDKKHTKTEKFPVDATNHVNINKVSQVEPTYDKVGYTEGVYCNDCKKYISGHKEIPVKQKDFFDGENAKNDGSNIVAKAGFTVSELLSQASDNAYVTDKDGKKVTDAVLGTGMKIVFPSGDTVVIVVFGDVDGNGLVAAADARYALRASVGLENFDDAQTKASDNDGKAGVAAADARLILRASVGLEDPAQWL